MSKLASHSSPGVSLGLGHCLNDEKYSDLTITCKDKVFKVHRVIVCGQSTFFDTASGGNFKEAHERVINLPEDDPEHISLMLQFLYESRIEFDKKASKEQTIVAHGQLFGIACKYGIDKLKGYSAAEFAKLKGSVQEEYMIKALANAYSQAELPRESLLLDKLFDENLLHIPAADSKSFRMLLESNPGFAAAFAVKMLERFNFHKLLAPEYYHFLENVLDKGKHQGRKWKCFTTHCICYPCDNVVVIGDPDAQGVRYIESKCQKCKRANLKIAGFI